MAARRAFDKHVAACQLDIKGVRLNVPMPDFGAAIKGLSSLASIDDKLTDALISSQAEVNTLASRIINNLQTLDSVPPTPTRLPTGRSWPTRTARRWGC